jgi:tetratricopeptide (TPR) repeat protein
VRYQQNRFDGAIAAFREVLRLDPANVKAEDNLGLSLEGKNQMEEAQAAYEKAISLDKASSSHNEQPYLNLGMLLAKTNRAQDAVPLLQRAAEISPGTAQIRYQLGKAYFDLHRLPEAQQATEEAIPLNPKDPTAHYLLGRIYQRLNKTDLAAKEFKLTEELRRFEDAGRNGMGSASSPR